jgi:hypothetical protein
MGVKVDPVWEDVSGPFKGVETLAAPLPGKIAGAAAPAGYLLSPSINDSFTIANRVMKANGEVYRMENGTLYVPASTASTPIVLNGVRELGVNVEAPATPPANRGVRLAPRRIALWDTQTGSMPSGWTRYILERFEFPFTVVCGAGFDDAELRGKYDVIVMPSGASLRAGGGVGGRGGGGDEPPPTSGAAASKDPDLRSLCEVSTGSGAGAGAEANVKKFVEAGGVVIGAGSAARTVVDLLHLPAADYLVDRQPAQPERPLSADKFYVPGSVLRVAVDRTASSAAGAEDHVDVFFNNNPVFRLAPDAAAHGVRAVMWFDTDKPLRSGWAWGQNYLEGGTTAIEATVGKGKAFAFGPEITFRAQPHGTFKFLFNAILAAPASASAAAGNQQ